MPFYFAGSLESGNVCEYSRMMHFFHELGIKAHDPVLYEMGMKEKEHKIYFLDKIKDNRLLLFFEKIFAWVGQKSFNAINLAEKYPVDASDDYCRK